MSFIKTLSVAHGLVTGVTVGTPTVPVFFPEAEDEEQLFVPGTGGTGAAAGAAGGDLAGSYPNPTLNLTGLTAADAGLTDTVPEYNAVASANRSISLDRLGGFVYPAQCPFRLSGVSQFSVADVSGGATLYLVPWYQDVNSGLANIQARLCLFDGTRGGSINPARFLWLSPVSAAAPSTTFFCTTMPARSRWRKSIGRAPQSGPLSWTCSMACW